MSSSDDALLFAFLWLAVVHFVADFLLQAHWVSLAKSKHNWVLALHVAIYSGTLLIGIIPLHALLGRPSVEFVAVNGLLHFCTDYVTSRINARLWAAGRTHWFFVGVGADQLAHYLALGFTLAWVIK